MIRLNGEFVFVVCTPQEILLLFAIVLKAIRWA